MVTARSNGERVTASDVDAPTSTRNLFGRFRRSADPGLHVADLDDHTFAAASNGCATVVDFWAPWCNPCKQLHPLFEARAAAHAGSGVQFARIDVDRNTATAATFGIMSIPTIVVLDADGVEIDREVGMPSKRRLEQLIRSARSVTPATASPATAATSPETGSAS